MRQKEIFYIFLSSIWRKMGVNISVYLWVTNYTKGKFKESLFCAVLYYSGYIGIPIVSFLSFKISYSNGL